MTSPIYLTLTLCELGKVTEIGLGNDLKLWKRVLSKVMSYEAPVSIIQGWIEIL